MFSLGDGWANRAFFRTRDPRPSPLSVSSSSYDVVLDRAFVPTAMSWPFGLPKQPDPRHFSGSLYCYPGYAMGGMQVGFVAIGIAQGAIDRAVTLAPTKPDVASSTTLRERPTFPIGPADAVALVRGSRAWLQDALREFGSFVVAGEEVSYAARANRLLASPMAVHNYARPPTSIDTQSGAKGPGRHYLVNTEGVPEWLLQGALRW